MLDVRDLCVSYGQHRALENAALTVRRGEIAVILGANGAGKTTLLKALCGICEGRVTGSVLMDGQEILGLPPHRIVEAGIALVPEGRGVFPDLTVAENLTLGVGAERARDEEAGNMERVLDLFPKLAERRRQVVRTMSGGEQQMVAIGRAMMSNPQVLALDEPSLGLSPLLCKDLFQNLATVRGTGLGILLVEQNAKQSLKIADRGYLLENGEIVHEDDADALARDPAVQKAYLGATGGAVAPRTGVPKPASAPKPPERSAPRPAAGPSPGDIAAAAMKSVPAPKHRSAPAPQTAGAPPRAKPELPDTAAMVQRVGAPTQYRRPTDAGPNGPKPPAPNPETGGSGDRLRAVLDEIEAAARRAETYKPRNSGR